MGNRKKLIDRCIQTELPLNQLQFRIASLSPLIAPPYPTDLAAWTQYQQCLQLAIQSVHTYESNLFQKLYLLLPEPSKRHLEGNHKLESLAQHVENVLEDTSKMVFYLCTECGASFAKLSVLKSHSLTHSDYRPHECTVCSKGFRTSSDLEKHCTRVHFQGGPVMCDQCGKNCKGPEQLARHLKTVHEAPKPHVCEVCNEAFVKQFHLRRHTLSHDPKAVMCQLCGVYFRHQNLLTRHRETKHSTIEYSCDQCDARLKSKSGLSLHQANHAKKLMPVATCFECNQCGARFTSAPSLTYHRRRMHDGMPIKTCRGQRRVLERKKHKCEECGRIFTKLHAFKAHLRIHLNEKPYVCEDCGTAFRQQSILYRHRLRQHIKLRAFQCEICYKDFVVKGDLARHLISHSENRPFQCDFCTSTFKTRSDLHSHRARHIAPVKHGGARRKRMLDSKPPEAPLQEIIAQAGQETFEKSTLKSKNKKHSVIIDSNLAPREILESLAE